MYSTVAAESQGQEIQEYLWHGKRPSFVDTGQIKPIDSEASGRITRRKHKREQSPSRSWSRTSELHLSISFENSCETSTSIGTSRPSRKFNWDTSLTADWRLEWGGSKDRRQYACSVNILEMFGAERVSEPVGQHDWDAQKCVPLLDLEEEWWGFREKARAVARSTWRWSSGWQERWSQSTARNVDRPAGERRIKWNII